MKTSSFFSYKGKGRISIANYQPSFLLSDNIPEYRQLAPSVDLLKLSENDYIPKYNYILSQLDARQTFEDLCKLSQPYEPILLCWEKAGDFCHRRIVADWIFSELSVEVLEYNYSPTPDLFD